MVGYSTRNTDGAKMTSIMRKLDNELVKRKTLRNGKRVKETNKKSK